MQKKISTIDFRAALRKSCLKATGQRLTVLQLLVRAKSPQSPRAIAEGAPDIDQATVYRMLKLLEAAGVVRRVDFGHTHAHYEVVGGDDHHHLICTSCGRAEDIHRCNVDEMAGAVLRRAEYFSKIDRHALEFYGLCNACIKKTV